MADTEKVSFNISVVDLGQIDLLVEQGFYSSRTDFIRTAVRNQLQTHAESIQQTVTRRSMVLGVLTYDRSDLERYRSSNEKLEIRAIGAVVLNDDISPELAEATIESIRVLGVLRASSAVKRALAKRIKTLEGKNRD